MKLVALIAVSALPSLPTHVAETQVPSRAEMEVLASAVPVLAPAFEIQVMAHVPVDVPDLV